MFTFCGKIHEFLLPSVFDKIRAGRVIECRKEKTEVKNAEKELSD